MQLEKLYEKGIVIPEGVIGGTPVVIEGGHFTQHVLIRKPQGGYCILRKSGLGAAPEFRDVALEGVVYIAGPMRGYEKYNFPSFDLAASHFINAGFYVFNPAELDRAVGVNEDTTNLPPDFLRGAMDRDMNAITRCTHIALIDGWEASSGVRPEAVLSSVLDLKFYVQMGKDSEVYKHQPKEAVCACIGARMIGDLQKHLKELPTGDMVASRIMEETK